jgi:hypothetical protein
MMPASQILDRSSKKLRVNCDQVPFLNFLRLFKALLSFSVPIQKAYSLSFSLPISRLPLYLLGLINSSFNLKFIMAQVNDVKAVASGMPKYPQLAGLPFNS